MAKKSKPTAAAQDEAVATTQPATEEAAAPVTVLTDINALTVGARFRSRVNRSTSARINSFRPVAPGTTFVNVCETHGGFRHYGSRKACKDDAYAPGGPVPNHETATGWCEGCKAVYAQKRAPKAEEAAPAAEA